MFSQQSVVTVNLQLLPLYNFFVGLQIMALGLLTWSQPRTNFLENTDQSNYQVFKKTLHGSYGPISHKKKNIFFLIFRKYNKITHHP